VKRKSVIKDFPQCNSWSEGKRCWKNAGHKKTETDPLGGFHSQRGSGWYEGDEDGGSPEYLHAWSGWNRERAPLHELVEDLNLEIKELQKRRRELLAGHRR